LLRGFGRLWPGGDFDNNEEIYKGYSRMLVKFLNVKRILFVGLLGSTLKAKAGIYQNVGGRSKRHGNLNQPLTARITNA